MEEQRIFASFINNFVYIITKQWFARFLKTFLPKLSATRTLRLCRSLCLRHLRDIVCFHLRVLSLSVWLFSKVLTSKGITPNCWSSKKLAPQHQEWWHRGKKTKIKLPSYCYWYHIKGISLKHEKKSLIQNLSKPSLLSILFFSIRRINTFAFSEG